MGTLLRPLGNNHGVQEEVHSSSLRGRSARGVIVNPDLRSGEAAKNSARFPLRRVLRSHSSAATTTTAVRFFFNVAATTEIYTLSLHYALPILAQVCEGDPREALLSIRICATAAL